MSNAQPTNVNVLDQLDDLLVKVAAEEKKAQDDPGGYSGPSTHPVAREDNSTVDATEGARSSENVSDVKSDYGDTTPSSESSENPQGGSEHPSDSIGTQSQEAAEVAGNVQEPKATKEGPSEGGRGDASPGHPSNLTFNEKYSFEQNAGNVSDLGNRVLAQLTIQGQKAAAEETPNAQAGEGNGATDAPQKESTDGKNADAKAQANTESDDYEKAAAAHPEDAEAGYMAAQMLADHIINQEKQAENGLTVHDQVIDSLCKSAAEDAHLLCNFVEGWVKGETEKRAMPMPMGEGGDYKDKDYKDKDYKNNDDMAAADMAETAETGEGDSAPMLPEGGDMPPELGGEMPPELGGEMPPMLGGGEEMPGEGGLDDQVLVEALAEALAEAGVSPDELLAAGAAGGAGVEGLEGGEGAAVAPDSVPKMASAGSNAAQLKSFVQKLVSNAG